MMLKTYRAPDLATALERARAEMGPNALVLGTTEKPARFGLSTVEVTVGVAREQRSRPADSADRVSGLAREVDEVRSSLERDPDMEQQKTPRHQVSPAGRTKESTWRPHPALRSTVQALIASGVSRDLAQRFARMAEGGLPETPDAGTVAEVTTRCLGELLPFAAPPALGGRCTFVVGPPGCGKTTTAAKLVARAVVSTSEPVFFAQTDRDRIGSFEQAEILARYIGARVARVEQAEDLQYVLRDAGEGGTVVIDTPGLGARDGERLEELLELRRLVPQATVVLLVPAGLHHTEASRIIDRFAPLNPQCVGVSRIDDAAAPGELVTALARSGLPLALFTNGPSIPDDLEPASPRGLAALLLRAGSEANAQPENMT